MAVLTIGGATGALADNSLIDGPIKWNVFVQGGFAVDGSSGLPYAQYYGPDLQSAPSSTVYPFTVGSGSGFDIGGGVSAHFDNPWSANLAYTGLRSSKSGDTGQYGDYAVVSVLPNGYKAGEPGVGTSYNEAKVKTDVAADVIDFQAGYDVGLGEGISGTVLGGLRYAQISQNTHVGILDLGGFLEYSDHRDSKYWGLGPTVGLKASMPFEDSGFGVSGSLVGGLLIGQLKSDTDGADSSGRPVNPRNISSTSLAETINSEVALTYMMPSGPFQDVSFAAGYQVAYYAGVRDTRNGSSGNGAAVYGSVHDDLLDHGPFLRISYGF